MKPAAIIYDWNGTLLDDVDAAYDCFNMILNHFGHDSAPIETFRANYDVPYRTGFASLGVKEAAQPTFGATIAPLFAARYEPMADRAVLRTGCAEALQTVREFGALQTILSNHTVPAIKRQLERLSIDGFFHDVIANDSLSFSQRNLPKGEKLRRYMQDNDLSTSKTFIIGDTPEEIRIAHDLKIVSVAITGGYASAERLASEQPDFIIEDLTALPALLASKGAFA